MKKLLSIFIIGIMVFGTGAVAFATGTDQTNAREKNRPAAVEKMKQVRTEINMRNNRTTPAAIKVAFTEAQLKKLNDLRIEIKENQKEMISLKKAILTDFQTIKKALGTVDRQPLGLGQLTKLRDINKELKADREDICKHAGTMMGHAKNIKNAKHFRDFDAAVASMNKIIDEQEARILILTDLQVALDKVVAELPVTE